MPHKLVASEIQFSGQPVFRMPKNILVSRALSIEAFARRVEPDTVEANLKVETDIVVSEGLRESEIEDCEAATGRYSKLRKDKRLEILFHNQLRLMKDREGLALWFVTINLTQKEDTQPHGANGVLQSLFKRTKITPIWTGVHVPARKGRQERGHLHVMVAIPRDLDATQRLVDFARVRNSRQDRLLGKTKARSVVTYGVYDVRGLYRYFAGPKNLRRLGACVLASQSVRSYLRKAKKSAHWERNRSSSVSDEQRTGIRLQNAIWPRCVAF